MSKDNTTENRRGILDLVERSGNRLPDPATLFLIGTVIVVVISAIAASQAWTVAQQLPEIDSIQVERDGVVVNEQVLDKDGRPRVTWQTTGETYRAKSLLTRDGFFWLISHLVSNFMGFRPLGVVLVGMLGIGVAERTGLIRALLKAFMAVVPGSLLTPAMVFLGIMSSITLDAGYVVLPPLAAALYLAAGRSPLVGLAAVFAGVAAGFNANLLITGLDPMLAQLSNEGAQVVDPTYQVNPGCNWYFMVASTAVITLTGWAVTTWFVERRMSQKPEAEGGPRVPDATESTAFELQANERKGLTAAALAFLVTMALILTAILVPDAPLYTYSMPDAAGSPAERIELGLDEPLPEGAVKLDNGVVVVKSASPFKRWVRAMVPLLFFVFLIPAIAYGRAAGEVRNEKDVTQALTGSMAAMAPIIVLAFFAAQFIESFKYSGLDKMLAMAGGQVLGKADMPVWALIVAFILVTMVFNLFIGSMSAKYVMFAPIFIPMLMMVGISPELTQAAYRIGDSVSNIITPLNPYLIIILVFMQKYVPKGGMGTLISLMLPYTIAFSIVWTVLLLGWLVLGLPLGLDGYLTFPR